MPSNRHIERYVAPVEETPVAAVDAVDESQKASSVWGDAWTAMRKRWLTWVCLALIFIIVLIAVIPGVFATINPVQTPCRLINSLEMPGDNGHLLGTDAQGCDIYSRVVYGTRTSVTVGLLATIMATVIGGIIGAIAGYYGGWLDSVVSRLGDIFFAIPSVLGAVVVMSVVPWDRNVMTLALTLAVFGWPQVARIMRGAVLTSKQADYVMSAVALGVSKGKVLLRHVVPNALAPVIVIATVSLGTFIVAEATLSFLGIGLGDSTISWGADIS
ncbi:MAG: ABC transporter permease, partial [Galactobacter sp.]